MDYRLGDMMARYTEDAEGRVGLLLFPADCPVPSLTEKKAALDPLVQIQFAGDVYSGGYAMGNTLRNGESTLRMRKQAQEMKREGDLTRIETLLADDRGNQVLHTLTWQEGDRFVRTFCEYRNGGDAPRTLLLLSSFSLEQISPYLPGDGAGKLRVHRLQSRWSQEGRLLTQTLEELQLEPSWAMGAVRCERFGQVGSMPVNHYFPFLAVEDVENHVFWGAQIAHPASWQMEIYRRDENLAVSGGLADREFGHWKKNVAPGERFRTPEAILTVASTERLDDLCQRLVEAGVRAADAGPASEQDLPILFNEYCTTWGVPSHENIVKILDAIRGRGISYFVIDCGWYKADGVHWAVSMGDYIPSRTLFPEGLEKTVEAIHAEGLKAGIWFEIENVGPAAAAYQETEHLLHLDGEVLSTPGRRFWNMTDPWVQDYLRGRVIGTLQKYGFDYMKIDYNDTIGIGCDGAESPGEGLRRNMMATMDFLAEVKREVPGIILENCASGGHRLEPGFMAATSMASFSDAHECPEIPIIAANLHRAILPRQSQIWAVIRKTDSCKRIAYSLASTFLGRMCLSGDVTELSGAQWAVIDAAIAFYRRIAPIIRDGQTYHQSPEIARMRHPEGWQGIVRLGKNGEAFALLHTFGGEVPEEIRMPLPAGTPETIQAVYSDTQERMEIRDGALVWRPTENWKAAAVLLTAGEP